MSDTRVPTVIEDFHKYIVVVNNRIHLLEPDGITLHGVALGMTLTEANEHKALTKEWTNADPLSLGLWEKYSDPTTKTEVIVSKVNKFIKDYSVSMRTILLRISGSTLLNEDDLAIFNISLPPTKHTKPEKKITAYCYAALVPTGGGGVRIVCKVDTDASRASKPEGSNALEYAYRLDKPVLAKAPDGGDDADDIVVPTVLADPDDGTTKAISTKASFYLEFGVSKSSWTFHIFARWISTTHPELNGPWTGPFKVTLS
jgi:hypothetical protein